MKQNIRPAVTMAIAAALILAGQTCSHAQFYQGDANAFGADGTAYQIASTQLDTNGQAYVLDDTGFGGSGTQVDLWQVNNGANQYWTLNNLGGNDSDYYTIQSYYWASKSEQYCLDCSNSGTAAGTVVQLWDCNGTWAQNWAIQTLGINQPVMIIPGNAYSMALTAPGPYNGALLTLQPQSGNTAGYYWVLTGTDATEISNGSWCSNHAAACAMSIVGSIVFAAGLTAGYVTLSGASAALSDFSLDLNCDPGTVFPITSPRDLAMEAFAAGLDAKLATVEEVLAARRNATTIAVVSSTGLDIPPLPKAAASVSNPMVIEVNAAAPSVVETTAPNPVRIFTTIATTVTPEQAAKSLKMSLDEVLEWAAKFDWTW